MSELNQGKTDALAKMLIGKKCTTVRQHRANELMLEFSDGTRLFVDSKSDIEISVTGGGEESF